jgi:hypothetical protein
LDAARRNPKNGAWSIKNPPDFADAPAAHAARNVNDAARTIFGVGLGGRESQDAQ